jgi:hypothetical protein
MAVVACWRNGAMVPRSNRVRMGWLMMCKAITSRQLPTVLGSVRRTFLFISLALLEH